MQAGHRHHMGRPGPLKSGVGGIIQAALVPGHQTGDQPCHIGREGAGDLFLQMPRPEGGPVPEGGPLRPVHLQRTPEAAGEKDPPGIEGIALLSAHGVGQFQRGTAPHRVPRPQGQERLVSIEHRPQHRSVLRREGNLHRCAIPRGGRPVGHHSRERMRASAHLPGRGQSAALIEGRPQEPGCQSKTAQPDQQHASLSLPQEQTQAQTQTPDPQRQQPSLRQQQNGEQDGP